MQHACCVSVSVSQGASKFSLMAKTLVRFSFNLM